MDHSDDDAPAEVTAAEAREASEAQRKTVLEQRRLQKQTRRRGTRSSHAAQQRTKDAAASPQHDDVAPQHADMAQRAADVSDDGARDEHRVVLRTEESGAVVSDDEDLLPDDVIAALQHSMPTAAVHQHAANGAVASVSRRDQKRIKRLQKLDELKKGQYTLRSLDSVSTARSSASAAAFKRQRLEDSKPRSSRMLNNVPSVGLKQGLHFEQVVVSSRIQGDVQR